jgi:hypothetical protein
MRDKRVDVSSAGGGAAADAAAKDAATAAVRSAYKRYCGRPPLFVIRYCGR